MFRAKTLLILGAGASFEVGLPIGETLLKQISELINFRFEFGTRLISGDTLLLESLKLILNEGREVTKLSEHLRACQQLRKSAEQALSIDNVIDALEDPKVELIGKLGILRAVLKAENGSNFFRPPPEQLSGLDITPFNKTWYGSLTKLLTENIRRSEIAKLFENLEIINFNYDRCLERYLPFSLSDYYGVGVAEIEDVMQGLRVHRPYGLCGSLPWMRTDKPKLEFGQQQPDRLAAVVDQIRTFTEQVQEGEELDAMKVAVRGADRIIFLGFAFHRQNIRLLATGIQDHAEVLATAYKISGSDQAVIKSELAKAFDIEGLLFEQRVELVDLTCDDLFKQFWRTLTAEPNESDD